MLYMFLICTDPTVAPDPGAPPTLQPQHATLERELREEGVYVSGAALMPPEFAPVARVKGGLATDGPFAETRELVGGYYLLNCSDREHAIACAARIPVATDDWVDVRPVFLFHPDVDGITRAATA